jgi:hypothetical protein
MMNRTYLIEMTIVSDQKISDSVPRTLAVSTVAAWAPLKTSFMVYSGLVPTSP